MKKLLSSLLALITILSLASCGEDKEEQSSSSTTSETVTEDVTTTAETTTLSEETKSGLSAMETPEYDDLNWGDFEVQG